ncbi:MAG TPA: hypothetical protein VF450_22175, partial [Noviherbaspirillum sp.]
SKLWSPVIAIFVEVAASFRHCIGYSIHARNASSYMDLSSPHRSHYLSILFYFQTNYTDAVFPGHILQQP